MHIDGHITRSCRPKGRRAVSLTALIDVIFLLVLFFMLSSTFTRFAKVEISGAPATTPSQAKPPDILIGIDSAESWRVNGRTFTGREAAIAYLTRLEAAGAKTAAILVRGTLTSQSLVEAIERISRHTGLTLNCSR